MAGLPPALRLGNLNYNYVDFYDFVILCDTFMMN